MMFFNQISRIFNYIIIQMIAIYNSVKSFPPISSRATFRISMQLLLQMLFVLILFHINLSSQHSLAEILEVDPSQFNQANSYSTYVSTEENQVWKNRKGARNPNDEDILSIGYQQTQVLQGTPTEVPNLEQRSSKKLSYNRVNLEEKREGTKGTEELIGLSRDTLSFQKTSHRTLSTGLPPTFLTSLVTQNVLEGYSVSYALPSITDPNGLTATITTGVLPYFITFDGVSTLTISPALGDYGTYTISIYLSDTLYSNALNTFSVVVTQNLPPHFNTDPLPTSSITYDAYPWGYGLPLGTDPEGKALTYSLVNAPSWFSISGTSVTMNPTASDGGQYIISVDLSDGVNVVQYTFTVNLASAAPHFVTALVAQSVLEGYTLSYTLPAMTTTSGLAMTVSISALPTFITFTGTVFTFAPVLGDWNTYNISISIADTSLTYTTYLILNVIQNYPPYFNTAPLANQAVTAGLNYNYALPAVTDPEAYATTIVLWTAPGYVSYVASSNCVVITPPVGTTGSSTVTMQISDGVNVVDYSFVVSINLPPSFNAALGPVTVTVGILTTYTLPAQTDPQSLAMTITITSIPGFMSYTAATQSFSISATNVYIGSNSVTLTLADTYFTVSYSFIVNVNPSLPPSFISALPSIIVTVGEPVTYTLPAVTDPQGFAMTVAIVSMPSGFTFTPAILTFSITALAASVGTQTVSLTLSDAYNSVAYSFSVTVNPNLPPSFATALAAQTVTAMTTVTYTLPSYSDPESDPIVITTSLPTFMAYTAGVITMSPLKAQGGTIATAQVSLSDGINALVTYSFTVTVNAAPLLPPYFVTAPVDQIVQVGSSISYTLPSVTDPQSYAVSITTNELFYTSLPSFMTYSGGTYTIHPTLSSQTGTHSIEITLNDGHTSVINTFSVTVTKPTPTPSPVSASTVVNTTSTSSTSNSTSNSSSTSSSSSSSNATSNATATQDPASVISSGPPSSTFLTHSSTGYYNYVDKKSGLVVKIINIVPKIPLSAIISSVDMKGMMTVQFSFSMIVPANYTLFNGQFLDIELVPGVKPMAGQNKSIQAWQITSFTSSQMMIFLNFTNPMIISQSLTKDSVSVKFLSNGYFLRASDKEAIKYQYQMSQQLPPQLVETTAVKTMEAAGNVAGGSMNYMLYGNLGLQVFLSVSMQLLWGMVNTLQLIIHMNMLSVIMPANVQLFFSFIVDIVNFKIIPTDVIITKIFGSAASTSGTVSPQFQQTGYTSTNVMKNIGMLFLVILVFIGAVFFVFLLKFAAKKFAIVAKLVTIISRKLFFNSILRSFLESYLKFCISTWISIDNIQIDTEDEIINAWITVALAIIMIGFPLFTFLFLRAFKPKLEEEDFKGRFESLYLNVDTKNDRPILLISLFVFRRLIFAANVVMFAGSTVAQLFVQFFCCLLMLLFFTDIHPMNQSFLNRMEIFNECTLLACSYCLFIFTDYVPDPATRYMMGWLFVGIAGLNIFLNWCALFYKVYLAVKQVLREVLKKWRIKQAIAKKQDLEQHDTEENQLQNAPSNAQNGVHLGIQQMCATDQYGIVGVAQARRNTTDVTFGEEAFSSPGRQRTNTMKKMIRRKHQKSTKIEDQSPPAMLPVSFPAPLPLSHYESSSTRPSFKMSRQDSHYDTYDDNSRPFDIQTQIPQFHSVYDPESTNSQQAQLKLKPLYAQNFPNIVLHKQS